MSTLILLRHGKSDWSGGEPDHLRPLARLVPPPQGGSRRARPAVRVVSRQPRRPEVVRACAAFRRDGVVEELAPSRLGEVQTVHAMSVHRSQGSQFKRVTLVLPPKRSPLLTPELVYTAITRAEEHVRVIGKRAALEAAVRTPITRASGLRRG